MKRRPSAAAGERRGAVLVILIVLLLVAASIAAAVLRAALLDARQFTTDRRAVQADRLAEAGLARAAARLGADSGYSGEEWAVELPGGELGMVVVTVRDTEAGRAVEAVAAYPAGEERPVRSRKTAVVPAG